MCKRVSEEMRDRNGKRTDLADVVDVKVQLGGDGFEVVLRDDHALRTSEALSRQAKVSSARRNKGRLKTHAVSSVGDGVGLAATSADVDVGDEVAVVEMSDRAVANAARDVE